jgi:hypothetical protein
VVAESIKKSKWRGEGEKGLVRGGVATSSEDLGGRRKYTSENLEGRSGERFRENSI